jgi:arylsulfatase A-like enzyme
VSVRREFHVALVFLGWLQGPDIPGMLFDDAGYFRGKKRSLHEGGIRQTLVVQWPGTIAANSISDDLFIFYDLLPTAAELAGVPRSSCEPAVSILESVHID